MATFRKKDLRAVVALIFLLVATIAGQAFVSATLFHPDRVVVWVFDVGQGDAIFIDGPDKDILIDGGPNGVVVEKLSAVMPFWDRSIDIVINTHPHADHVTGLNHVLERYRVSEVWVGGQDYGTGAFAYFEELAREKKHVVSVGRTVDLGSGAHLEVLWPHAPFDGETLDDPNAGSIVTLLTYRDTTVLLTGDIGVKEERLLQGRLEHVDVLKVGHQGSKTSSASGFLQAISPDYAVISVGKNDYGHPHAIVLDRLERFAKRILRTDTDGDIRILSDGGEPSITTFEL